MQHYVQPYPHKPQHWHGQPLRHGGHGPHVEHSGHQSSQRPPHTVAPRHLHSKRHNCPRSHHKEPPKTNKESKVKARIRHVRQGEAVERTHLHVHSNSNNAQKRPEIQRIHPLELVGEAVQKPFQDEPVVVHGHPVSQQPNKCSPVLVYAEFDAQMSQSHNKHKVKELIQMTNVGLFFLWEELGRKKRRKKKKSVLTTTTSPDWP